MTVPVRIQLSRRKGWHMPGNTMKVDRATPWGNPFKVGEDGTAERCVQLYIQLLSGLICMSGRTPPSEQQRSFRHAAKHLHDLRGKNLACWCRVGKPCHADVLLKLANA